MIDTTPPPASRRPQVASRLDALSPGRAAQRTPSTPGTLAGSRTRSTAFTRRGAALLAIGVAIVLAQPSGHAQSQGVLPYAGGYLLTGDYAVGSVNVTGSATNGFVTGTIPMSAVPPNAEIVDALLFWETITTSADLTQARGVQFRGADIDIDNTWLVKRSTQALTGQTASCWTAGTPLTMSMFRANVLQYLPQQTDKNGLPTGRRVVNDVDLQARGLALHTVKLPKFGTGNVVPESAGATLLLFYRDTTKPLRKIVLYDGIYVEPPDGTMTQSLQGFYRSALTRSARLTHIAASGQKNSTDTMYFNGTTLGPAFGGPSEPFPDSPTASDRAWASPTYDVSSLMPGTLNSEYGETATTAVNHRKNSPYECLTWGAVVLSTSVQDADGDGIPDGLEQAGIESGGQTYAVPGFPLKDPGGAVLPDLAAMGARSDHKDMFVELNGMWAPPGTSYGTQVDGAGHNHIPSPQVLKMIGDALKSAPSPNPDGSTGIKAHFDVGKLENDAALDGYHSRGVIQHTDWVDDFTSTEADEYLVPSALARGGELIRERACVPSDTASCPFPAYPGTVGWKLGFDALKYAPVGGNGEELTSAELDAWLAGSTRRVRFDPARIGLFRYVLYAHARGIPKSLFPCLNAQGNPAAYDAAGGTSCTTASNPDFSKPFTGSGVADLPGNSAMVTLGLWDDFLGRPAIQANTTFHELGHTLELWHGGIAPTWGTSIGATPTATYVEPNCKPNYVSVMSYLFQAKGLMDDAGNAHVDYSRDAYGNLDENFLSDGLLASPLAYRTAWYAPLASGTLGAFLGVTPAKRLCSGGSILSGSPPIGRIEGGGVAEPIDWNGDGSANTVSQDANFDGVLNGGTRPPLRGFNDWDNLRLTQAGSGLNAFGRGDGILKAEGGGIFTLGDGGILKAEGGGILKVEGGGILKVEGGGILKVEGGGILTVEGVEDVNGGILKAEGGGILKAEGGGILKAEGGGQELSYDNAKAFGRTPPNALKACVLGVDCGGASSPLHRARLRWEAPNVGHVFKYRVYRVLGGLTVKSTPVLVGEVSAPAMTLVDSEELPDGKQFTYFVTAEFDDETPHGISGPSNTAIVTAVNDAPVAVNDNYGTSQGTALVVPARGVLLNDTDVDSPATSLRAVKVTDPLAGRLQLNADGSFTYTPVNGFNGTDRFTYKANDGVWSRDPSLIMSKDSNVATVTILVGSANKKK